MNGTLKMVLIVLGALAAILILAQLGLGLTIINAKSDPAMQASFLKLTKTHQHTGYLTVAVVVVYVIASLAAICRIPKCGSPESGA